MIQYIYIRGYIPQNPNRGREYAEHRNMHIIETTANFA